MTIDNVNTLIDYITSIMTIFLFIDKLYTREFKVVATVIKLCVTINRDQGKEDCEVIISLKINDKNKIIGQSSTIYECCVYTGNNIISLHYSTLYRITAITTL